MTADDFFQFAKKNQAEMVDLKFVDLLGSVAALLVPRRHARHRHVRGRPRVRRLVDPRLDGHPRVRHAGRARTPTRPASIRSLPSRRSASSPTSSIPSPGKEFSRDPRHIARKAEAYLKEIGDRRHLLHRARAGVLHLRRGPLRAEPAPRLLRDRLGRRRLEHGPHRGAEPRLQAELQGRLLSRQPDRHLPRPARRDGPRDAQDRHHRRGAPPRGGHGRPERDRHAVPAAAARWPISSCGTSTSARTSRSATARR